MMSHGIADPQILLKTKHQDLGDPGDIWGSRHCDDVLVPLAIDHARHLESAESQESKESNKNRPVAPWDSPEYKPKPQHQSKPKEKGCPFLSRSALGWVEYA